MFNEQQTIENLLSLLKTCREIAQCKDEYIHALRRENDMLFKQLEHWDDWFRAQAKPNTEVADA